MNKAEERVDLDIRLASLEEGPAVLELWQGSARWLQAKGINQWQPEFFNIEQVSEWFNTSEIYLARWNKAIVGTLLLCSSDPFMWEKLDSKEASYIHRFAVSRDHKGMGVGTQLLQWAEQYAKNSGKRYMRLDCMADNERLNHYYQSCGYQYVQTKEWDNWRANLYEKVIAPVE